MTPRYSTMPPAATPRDLLVRRAKIVCTLGPAVDDERAVRALIAAGMDVARLNFSHGSHEEHQRRLEMVRTESARAQKPVAVLQDLGGPKIRTGRAGPAEFKSGSTVEILTGEEGGSEKLSIDYPSLREDLFSGDRILLADGHIELRVVEPTKDGILVKVEHGGRLRARMGVNFPSHRLRLGALTAKDRDDLSFGLNAGVDYVALSFVRRAADVEELRALCEAQQKPTPIIAKIETPSAVKELEGIVGAADGVMVARGDLGVELPPEKVPVIQKQIIAACRRLRKPVIVATEMLASMVDAPRPTRAEASDVATGVYGNADALMLSAETATGKYPSESCAMMQRIMSEVENSPFFQPAPAESGDTTLDALADAACRIAEQVKARFIVTLTENGNTARVVSEARPLVPILALSPNRTTLQRLSLYWGVTPWIVEGISADLDEQVRLVNQLLAEHRFAAPGDRYVLVYGSALDVRGATNAVRVEQV